MSAITTHVLDTAKGLPAAGVAVRLSRREGEVLKLIGTGVTDADGRARQLLGATPLEAGEYQITFEVGEYLSRSGQSGFFPRVSIDFVVVDAGAHYHVPLLLSPFGYSTYRGS